MLERTRGGWATACFLGFGTLFVAFSIGGLLQSWAWPADWPEPSSLPSFDPATGFGGVDPGVAADLYRANLAFHFIHITVFGGVIGWLQAKVLGAREIRPRTWVLLTALGFASIFLFEGLRPGVVTGGHPAPIEPLLIGVGGGIFAGVYQWLYLRRRGVVATKWLGLWVAGLCAGAVAAAAVITLLGLLGPLMRSVLSGERLFRVSQFVFYLAYGPTLGAVAGWTSGRAITEAVAEASGAGTAGELTAARP